MEEGRESRSIRFSVGGCFDDGCAVLEKRGSEDVDCGSFAVPEPCCSGKIGAIARICFTHFWGSLSSL